MGGTKIITKKQSFLRILNRYERRDLPVIYHSHLKRNEENKFSFLLKSRNSRYLISFLRNSSDCPSSEKKKKQLLLCLFSVAPMDRGDPLLDAGPGRPMPPRYEEHPRMPLRGPPFVDSRGPPGRHDRARFDADDPRMGRHSNNDFRGHPMELEPHPHERSLPMGPMEPPVRFDGPPRRDGPSEPIFARGRPVDNIPAPRTPPRQEPGLFFFLLYFLPQCKKKNVILPFSTVT